MSASVARDCSIASSRSPRPSSPVGRAATSAIVSMSAPTLASSSRSASGDAASSCVRVASSPSWPRMSPRSCQTCPRRSSRISPTRPRISSRICSASDDRSASSRSSSLISRSRSSGSPAGWVATCSIRSPKAAIALPSSSWRAVMAATCSDSDSGDTAAADCSCTSTRPVSMRARRSSSSGSPAGRACSAVVVSVNSASIARLASTSA